MKLKDLLKDLEGADPEAEVYFFTGDGCCGDNFNLEFTDVDHGPAHYPRPGEPTYYVQFYFKALDFLNSCRSSGTAQRAVKKMREE